MALELTMNEAPIENTGALLMKNDAKDTKDAKVEKQNTDVEPVKLGETVKRLRDRRSC